MVRMIAPFLLMSLVSLGQGQVSLSKRDPAEWKRLETLVRSGDWHEREKGFHILADLECSDRPAVDLLFELIRTENEFIDGNNAKGTGTEEGFNEFYYSEMLGHSFACFKATPKPEWFRILALGTYNPESEFARELAGYLDGEQLPWLIDIAPRHTSQYKRANLYPLLVWTVLGHPNWPAEQRSAVLAAAARGMDDPQSYVWACTAFSLAESGLPETADLLTKAKTKLSKRPGITPGSLRTIDKAIEMAGKKASQ